MDVVLAVRLFLEIREVPVKLDSALQHRVRALAQPRVIKRVLVFLPIQVRDLGSRAEDVRDVPERRRALVLVYPPPALPSTALRDPVPPAAERLNRLLVPAKIFAPLVPRLAQQVE